ncbi:MAG: tRNA preQ1(34) S-adenosylmethionine ribosyltransferase-isomerase QueA [Phreatobacter sp.]|uniref:tRNA preQ1(34) S-adenosylmethionine ribosyltransferase-isomerase QueA n=1 Tax=Phreatobacter sp. TaxID=1966341 RepID=UPI002734492A|nr:tRNA preQ1(34) S-adenosylmethionine ribosyltransferase-isomerase QueA [Phreatobacter sp.]MDP2803949.1 tRNA preQ1(34) S-adenosylmethionine ribosyltransferase-isomerase QueA [Phreatobacter sp.]
MRVDLFDFDLPAERIALRPASPRDAARLMVVGPGGAVADRIVRDLPDILRPGDALVFNDTRVIPAQLEGIRERAGQVASISATLHRRLAPDRWLAFVKGAKKLHPGDVVRFGETPEACLLSTVDAKVLSKDDDGVVFAFELAGVHLDEAIARVGHIPLPPYIASKRPEDAQDRADYQTVYARDEGSVAAPTAGLHFTSELLERLKARGVSLHFLTLHVGAGTFLPVKSEDTAGHRMHPEYGHVTAETAAALNAVRAAGGRIVAVGTTSLRLLESAAAEDGMIHPFAAETSIFITPGYRFRAVDVLMTNFHLPRSTLFMLVSAFAGLDTMKAAYARAIASGYRFYSYGDGSLLFREDAR